MRDVAILSYAHLPPVPRDTEREEVELVQPVVSSALARARLDRRDVQFTISGSCDYLLGRPFSFVAALDGIAPWPPVHETHVEMDGAWALYEAWVRLQCGDVDTAVVYAYGKSSLGDLPKVLTQQLDPYYLAPLGIDAHTLAGLQAQLVGAPLDPPPISDGAAAVVLAAGDVARRHCERPAWIRGIDHRIEPHHLGCRDLTVSASTRLAAEHAGATGGFDLASLHAPYRHQEAILKQALGLDSADAIRDPIIVAGLMSLGRAAAQIHVGKAKRVLAHATSGPCLQQNLVCVMEAAS